MKELTYEDLLERNKLQISELNTLTEEQDRHIVELEKENTELKVGRPKWHKVADGDLPGNDRYVWTNVGACYYDEAGWWDDFGRLQDVIAWCEPKFEE